MAYSGRDLSHQIIDGRYRVEYLLGRGGMGSVWSVQHVESLKRFALKTLESEIAADPNARDRLLREARAAAALRSRHVVQVVDSRTAYVHDGQPLPFLVMERLEGLTLDQWLSTRGALSPGQVVWLMRQVGRALGEAHAHGIIHRDLKPSNIFITLDEDGAPFAKLCDFGIAKLTASAAAMLLNSSGARTSTGDILGTPLYLAPELLRSAMNASPATDQWALALTVFKALTNREYFDGIASGPDLVLRIAQDPLPAPTSLVPGLPPTFDAWLLRSCARLPERRFESVAVQMEQLEAALAPAPPEVIPIVGMGFDQTAPGPAAPPPDFPAPVSRDPTLRRRRAGPGLALAIVWAIGGTAWFLWATPWGRRAASVPEPSASAATPTAQATAAPRPSPLSANASANAAPVDAPPAPVQSEAPRLAASSVLTAPRERATGSRTAPSLPTTNKPTLRPSPPVVTSTGAPTPARSASPAPTTKLKAGALCRRSSECESGLCLAEQCQ